MRDAPRPGSDALSPMRDASIPGRVAFSSVAEHLRLPGVLPDRPVADAAVAADIETLGEIERDLADVDTALRRLDDGSYWTCQDCSGPIGESRLDGAPLVRRCAGCESAAVALSPER